MQQIADGMIHLKFVKASREAAGVAFLFFSNKDVC